MPLSTIPLLFLTFILACRPCSSELVQSHADDEKRLQLIQKKFSTVKQDAVVSSSNVECPGNISGMLPKLLFIGDGHTGSSTLANLMNMHPELSYGLHKEHMFWYRTEGMETAEAFNDEHVYWEHNITLDGYKRSFNASCETRVFFDAQPNIMWLANPDASGFLPYPWKNTVPLGGEAVGVVKEVLDDDVKLIVMFRDPFKQMISRMSVDSDTACDNVTCLQDAFNSRTSCPADSMAPWLEVFPDRSLNWLFLRSEDYFTDPRGTLDKIFQFAGVSSMEFTEDELEVGAATGRRRSSTALTKDDWQEFESSPEIVDCRARLEEQTGLQFETWGPDSVDEADITIVDDQLPPLSPPLPPGGPIEMSPQPTNEETNATTINSIVTDAASNVTAIATEAEEKAMAVAMEAKEKAMAAATEANATKTKNIVTDAASNVKGIATEAKEKAMAAATAAKEKAMGKSTASGLRCQSILLLALASFFTVWQVH